MHVLNVNFMHPIYGTIFNVDVDLDFTVGEMKENLMLSGFLPKEGYTYRLALGHTILDDESLFEDINSLEDGDIFRIIADKVEKKPATTNLQIKLISLSVMKAHKGTLLEGEYPVDWTIEQLLKHLEERGYASSKAKLYYKETLVLGSTPLSEYTDGSIFSLKVSEEAPLVMSMDNRFKQLEEQLQHQHELHSLSLKEIAALIPEKSSIPIDGNRAINPTSEIQESLNVIVDRLVSKMGKEDIKVIKGYDWRILLVFLLFLAVITFFIYSLVNL